MKSRYMNLFKVSKRKVFIGEVAHVTLNIFLAIVTFALVYVGGVSTLVAIVLVLLSKWRIFAVRPRYWWANVLANIVDVTVSLSVVALLYLAGTSSGPGLQIQIALTTFYVVWLVLIKPQSKKGMVVLQAATALFLGTWTVAALSYAVPLWLSVGVLYVIGLGVARHVLANFEDSEVSLKSMIFGLILAEIGWLIYHWNIAYEISFLGDFRVPQLSIVALALGLCTHTLLGAARSDRKFLSAEVLAPVVFSVAIIVVLVAALSSGGPGII